MKQLSRLLHKSHNKRYREVVRQRQIEAQQKPQQEDLGKKLEKYAQLRQKGLLTEEQFQKLKAGLLSQM